MHKLKVTLKQHTPLIHFQHDQDGATLRASEVKPKLDKFILSKLTPEEKARGKSEGWIKSKNDSMWLDYKMKIGSTGETEEFLLASYIKKDVIDDLAHNGITAISDTSYFAQEKQNNQIFKSKNPKNDWNKIEKKGILEVNDISLILLLENKDIANIVVSQIQSFFLSNNFGTRQSKGFGCFLPTGISLDEMPFKLENNEELLKKQFLFVYKKNGGNTIKELLSTINIDYKLIKSGLTRPYAKSKLMLYAESLDNSIGWDKKYIKVKTKDRFETENGDVYELKCHEANRRSAYRRKDKYLYFRALLGLAEQFEFLLENPPHGNSRNKMIVKVKNTAIQRYQSPLLFKVIGNNIYLVGNDVSQDMLNIPFQFLVNFQEDDGYENEPVDCNGTPIKTPIDFSLRNFISFAMSDNTNNASLGYTTIKR